MRRVWVMGIAYRALQRKYSILQWCIHSSSIYPSIHPSIKSYCKLNRCQNASVSVRLGSQIWHSHFPYFSLSPGWICISYDDALLQEPVGRQDLDRTQEQIHVESHSIPTRTQLCPRRSTIQTKHLAKGTYVALLETRYPGCWVNYDDHQSCRCAESILSGRDVDDVTLLLPGTHIVL